MEADEHDHEDRRNHDERKLGACPLDSKYGRVTLEKGEFPEDEPVFVLRAKDKMLVPLLHEYRRLCEEAGSPARHLNNIDAACRQVEEWQAKNYTQIPQSAPVDD